jgi:hypothetical protein
LRSCPTVCALCRLGSPLMGVGRRVLQQKVRGLLAHPLIRWHGRFLSPCRSQARLTLGTRRLMGARAKSKASTGAPSYALAWMISDPVHSCAPFRALRWLGSAQARLTPGARRPSGARAKGKGVAAHHLLCCLGRFPTPCIPVPPFALFAGLSHPWRAPAIGRSSKK